MSRAEKRAFYQRVRKLGYREFWQDPDICLLCKTQKIGYVLRHKSKPWLIGLCRDCYKSAWEEPNDA